MITCVYNGWISPAATMPTLPSALNPSTTANKTNPDIEEDAAATALLAASGAAVAVFVVLLIVGVYYKKKRNAAAAQPAAARKQAGDGGGTYANVIYQEGDGEVGADDEDDDALINLDHSDNDDDDALITIEAAQC